MVLDWAKNFSHFADLRENGAGGNDYYEYSNLFSRGLRVVLFLFLCSVSAALSIYSVNQRRYGGGDLYLPLVGGAVVILYAAFWLVLNNW